MSFEPPFFWTQNKNPEPSVSQLSSYRHLPVQAQTEHTKLLVWRRRPFTFLLFGAGGRKGSGIISIDDLYCAGMHAKIVTNQIAGSP